MSNGQRSDLWITYLTVNGTAIPGGWDKKTGGAVTPQETKYRPAGSPSQVSLGGPRDVDNVTLERLFVRERDAPILRTLLAASGSGTATITQQALDENYVPWGTPLTYQGRLGKISTPDVDSNSQAASMISVEVSVAGTVN